MNSPLPVRSNESANQNAPGLDYFLPYQQLLSQASLASKSLQSVTKVRPVPQGYHTVTPYLIVEGAPKVMEFLKRVFSAEQKDFMSGPEGRVAHAEMKIGD